MFPFANSSVFLVRLRFLMPLFCMFYLRDKQSLLFLQVKIKSNLGLSLSEMLQFEEHDIKILPLCAELQRN